jgi:hypothetical protein
MVDLSEDSKRLLTELFTRTGGDNAATESMFDVGEAAGLDREHAGAAAEELIGWELVEVRTLSGGIAIAEDGVAEANRIMGGGERAEPGAFRLGDDPVLDEGGKAEVDRIVSRLKREAEAFGLGFDRLVEMIADLKTIDAQLTSPRPKTAVVRESFRSILAILDGAGQSGTDIRQILGE